MEANWLVSAGLGVVVILAIAAVVGVLSQAQAAAADKRKYPLPGKLWEAGGFNLHLLVKPSEEGVAANVPTVVLDAGLGIPLTYYTRLQDEIAPFARVVIYDRAGMGYSEDATGGTPHDALSNARALHTALASAHIQPPYVLAGHSAGGMNMLVFAQTYPQEVQGLVLIDSQHPDQFQRYKPENRNDGNKTLTMARAMGAASNFGVLRLMNAAQFLEGTELSSEAQAVLQAQFASPRFWKGIENEIAAWEKYTWPEARAVKSLGNIPLVVLTAEGTVKNVPEQLVMHQEYARLSTNGVQRTVAGVNHGNIVIKGAGQVAQAVREVLDAARNGKTLT